MRARQYIGAHVHNYIGAPRYNMIDVRANIYTRVYIYTRANHNYIVARLYIIIDVRANILTCAPNY